MKTIALVAASEFNAEDFQKRDADGVFDQVIAIDGGFAHLSSIGREPDVALGDYDSLGYVPACETLLQFPSHKDKSDMELALEFVAGEDVSPFASNATAKQEMPPAPVASTLESTEKTNMKGPRAVGAPVGATSPPTLFVYGALGGRLDHTIANIQLLARYAEGGMTISLIDRDCLIRFLVGKGSYELPRIDRGVVSVFALTPEAYGVTERGMEYPLDDATLTNRTTLGLSNELIGNDASISVREGTLLIIHP